MGGPDPSLAIGYSSSSMDGRTGGTNNQGSWVGDGVIVTGAGGRSSNCSSVGSEPIAAAATW